MKKVAFYTLGCKTNQYETNHMMDLFKKAGYEVTDFESFADVYVVNTCTVTNMSDRKSRQVIHKTKEHNPDSILCVVGCYAQVAKDELQKIEDVDIILGTNDRKEIVNKVQTFEHEKICEVNDIMKVRQYEEWGGTAYSERARVEIKIQDGCDRYCTYCIIPYARGPVRSRKMEDMYSEVLAISKTGIQEVVFTGIHIASYGMDLSKEIRLIDLLEKVHTIEGIERIRLGSLEPGIITEEFVSRLKALPKVCNHFHLSLQSGCDETLKRMNRRYTTSEFAKRVKLLRENIPEVALTTDIIVGFPGETEEEFQKTYEFLKEIQFSKMHIFKYSPRKGTPAATLPDQVDGNIKEERSHLLIVLSDENEKKFASQYIGKEIAVLFENETEGHTSNYLKCVSRKARQANIIENVRALEFENGNLIVE